MKEKARDLRRNQTDTEKLLEVPFEKSSGLPGSSSEDRRTLHWPLGLPTLSVKNAGSS